MPTPLSVPLNEARPAFLAALDAFEAAASSLDDLEMLAPSRCHGWSRLEVVVHVRVGLQEMLAAVGAVTEARPTVDAASYWTAWEADAESDPIPGILWTRRTASAYTRPREALEHLRMTCDGWRAVAAGVTEGAVEFQGQVIAAGDWFATWAVELTIHHLDLMLGDDAPPPDPSALVITRRTADDLAGLAITGLDDVTTVLRAFGRVG